MSQEKVVTQSKSGLGQGMSLLPDKPFPKQPQNIAQPKIVPGVSLPEKSRTQDKFISLTLARSKEVLKSKMVSKEIPPYTDQFYRPPPRPPDIPLQKFVRKLLDLDTDINHLNMRD